MADQTTGIPIESSLVYKDCITDLVTLLKRKYIQSLAFACYIVKPEDKDKFINDLSLGEIIFIQCLHGLLNEDVALSGMSAEYPLANHKLFKKLNLNTPAFEFWVRQNFKLNNLQVRAALTYSNKIRNSGLFLTPKSVHRILRGYNNVLRLRPVVRDMLLDANKTTQEETKTESETGLELDNDYIAIGSAEGLKKSAKKKSKLKHIVFVKKVKSFDISKVDNSQAWLTLKDKYQEVLGHKVLGGLEFSLSSSIYEKEFTLSSIGSSPLRRISILWLTGLLQRDHTLFSLTSNWLAFAASKDSTIISEGLGDWLNTTFIFPKNRLLSGARFLRRLKATDLFFILPRLEEIFVSLPITHIHPLGKLNLKDVVDGKVKRPKRKKRKVEKDQTKPDVEKTGADIGESVSLQVETLETNQIQFVFDSSETPKSTDQTWLDPSLFSTPCQPFQPSMTPANFSQPPLNYYQLDKSNFEYSNPESVCYYTEPFGVNISEASSQPHAYPTDGTECVGRKSLSLESTSTPPGGEVVEGEPKESRVTVGWNLPFQRQGVESGEGTPQPPLSTPQPPQNTLQPPLSTLQPPLNTLQPPLSTLQPPQNTLQPPLSTLQPPQNALHPPESTAQPTPRTPPPPVISRADSPKSLTSSTTNVDGVQDGSVDSILSWLEEKERVMGEALVKAGEAGRTEDLQRLSAGGGLELLRRARNPTTGETLLHIAAREDHESMVEYLTGLTDLDGRDLEGRTPLHTAVIRGRVTIVEILLEAGANPSLEDTMGRTPRDIALSQGKRRLAEKITALSRPPNQT